MYGTCPFCDQHCVDVYDLPEGTMHPLGELMLGHSADCPWRSHLAAIVQARKSLLCPCGGQNKRPGYTLCWDCLDVSAACGEPSTLFSEGATP